MRMLSDLFFLGYLGVFGMAAVACFAGVWGIRRIGDREARRGLRALLLTCGAWAVCHIGLFLVPVGWAAHLFHQGGLIIGFGTVWAWLYFCSAYSGRSLHRRPTIRRLSMGVFAVVALIKATNPFHGLYYTIEQMQHPFAYVAVDHHLLHWGSSILAYMLAAVGFFMLAELLDRTRGNRMQVAGLFGLVALPIVMNGIGHATPWLLDLSHEPLGGAAFAFGTLFLTSGRLEDAARVGRREEPALVLCDNYRIRNYNKQAARLLPGLRKGDAVGAVLEDALPELAGALGGSGEKEGEILETSGEGQNDRYVRPVEQPLPRSDGRLILLTDVTEQETRLEALSSNIPGVPYEFRAGPSTERIVAFVGEEADALLGLDPDPDGFYKRFVACIPEPHRDAFLRSVEEAVDSRSHWRQELPFNRPDGERIWLLGSAEPEEKGEGVLFRGLLLDVTERKEKERQLDAVFNHTYQFTGLMEPDGTMIEANDTALQFGDVQRKEVIGKPLWETRWAQTGPESIRKLKEAIRRAAEGEFVRYERPVAGKEETRIADFSIRPVTNEDGEVELLIPEARDITDLKQREETLQARRKKIEALYMATSRLLQVESRDSVPGCILTVLQDVFEFPLGHIGIVENGVLVPKKTTAKSLSRPPEPNVQSMDSDLVATRAIRATESVVVESVENLKNRIDYGALSTLAGIPIGEYGAVVIGKKTGSFDPFDLRLLEVLTSYAALVLDRLEREEMLVEAKEEAEEASQLKSAMLSNMSHEIRTPLMSMIGSADLLREDLEGEPAEMVDQIFRSGQRLRETLDSVLQLSRLESEEHKLDDNPVYLDVIVREVVQELHLRAQENGVSLEVENCGDSVEARLDETATRRIVTNLVENAIKFTPEGGQVQVRARPKDDETVLLEVEDTGVGIAEDARSDIFEAFKQESEGLNRAYEGSGLGLSIVHRLTTLMDGTIEVESEKGKGTRFSIRFPR